MKRPTTEVGAASERTALPVDQLIVGDCIEVLSQLPAESVDLVFADPPYNLQLRQELRRPNNTLVDAVNDAWDRFPGFEEYDSFTRAWLTGCRRVLKQHGSIWVIGTYHNIYRVGAIMQDLGFWFLNDVVWVKTNPMPNFRGVRLANAHETLIWAAKSERSRYTFNHHAAKAYNHGKQLRSDWVLPICTGSERLREAGRKVHSTQKPEALLERVLVIASLPGQVVLDPFMGSGTTGAVAKRLRRHWVGIEQSEEYAEAARARIAAVVPDPTIDAADGGPDTRRRRPRIAFVKLVGEGMLKPGERLCFDRDPTRYATILPDGRLQCGAHEGSIHQIARLFTAGRPCNGWEHWYYAAPSGGLMVIDHLRRALLGDLPQSASAPPR